MHRERLGLIDRLIYSRGLNSEILPSGILRSPLGTGTGAYAGLSGHGVDSGTADEFEGVGSISGVLKLR